MDVCLSNFEIERESLQTIGVAALVVAMKAHVIMLLTQDASLLNTKDLLVFITDDEDRSPAENQKDLYDAQLFLLKYEYKICQVLYCIYLVSEMGRFSSDSY